MKREADELSTTTTNTVAPEFQFTQQHQLLKEEGVSWALSHGLLISGTGCPITLLPCRVPRTLISKALALSTLFNSLVHKVSLDVDFVLNRLASVDDDFTQRLISILKQITQEGGPTQKVALGIHRSDYMVHQQPSSGGEPKLFQVEINTISAAFGGLGCLVSKLHKYLIERYEIQGYSVDNLPENNASKNIADSLAHAHTLHPKKESVVMMVVNSGEINSTDQRLLEYKLWEDHHVRLIRRSLTDVAERGLLNETTKELTIDGYVVAVCYYRSGYKPEDYPTQKEWNARLLMERSAAIKCPNINYHLIGTKKMQQVLAEPGVLEKYVTDPSHIALLRSCFTGLYSLDPQDNPEQIIKLVISQPDDYVMKPQREGGGNLLVGSAMVEALQKMSPTERAAYIIMDKIVPKATQTPVLLKNGTLALMDAISELGVYGVYLGCDKKEYTNCGAGLLVRTKSRSDADGGVCAGIAVLDSVYLQD